MCGIAGIASNEPLAQADRAAVSVMLDRLVHRGPDEAGCHHAPHVALGHRRLSIIDLDTGRQPIPNETRDVWTVVNGEIYNFVELRDDLIGRGHRFATLTDSECLVHLFEERGEACVDAIAGMFALAVWDQRKRALLLARDRLGVKPMYYHFDGKRLVFASELKALLAVPGAGVEIDPTALLDYLTFSFIPAPKTIFRNVHKLPAGHLLTFRDGRLTVRRYWDLRHDGYPDRPIEQTAVELWSRLKQATRPRLIADVPVGAFLSGGLDSAAVVTAMSRLARNRVVTLTCGFAEQAFDERPHAREVASALDTLHHEELVRPDAAELVNTLAWHFDEPFADASAIPTYCLSRCARRHVKVALSGDGGDESMAGYRRYRFDQYEASMRRLVPAIARRTLLGPLATVWPRRPWLPRPLRAAATLRNISTDAPTAHALSVATLDADAARGLLHPDVAALIPRYDPLDHARDLYRRCDAPDHLSKCQYVDIFFGLADGILTKVDRASMAHGLEIRSPMLDHRFVEFAWSIPPRQRINRTAGKQPLRLAVERELGPRAARRSKTGFDVPLDQWFLGPLRQRFQDALSAADSPLGNWFSPDAIGRVWTRHTTGRERCGPTLWKLAMFDAWAGHFMNARPSAANVYRVLKGCQTASHEVNPIPNRQSSIVNPFHPSSFILHPSKASRASADR